MLHSCSSIFQYESEAWARISHKCPRHPWYLPLDDQGLMSQEPPKFDRIRWFRNHVPHIRIITVEYLYIYIYIASYSSYSSYSSYKMGPISSFFFHKPTRTQHPTATTHRWASQAMSGRGHRPCKCQRSKKIWKPPISKGMAQIKWFHGHLATKWQKNRTNWIIFLQSSRRVGKEKDSNCLPMLFPCLVVFDMGHLQTNTPPSSNPAATTKDLP